VPSEARIRGDEWDPVRARAGGPDPGGPSDRSAGSGARPPAHAWTVLDRDRRLAAGAAAALFASMFLPWYQQNAVVGARKAAPLVSSNLNAFAVFSFIEAAVLLVALAVLYLLYERASGRRFHLPGGDGTVVFAAGLWVALLLVLRLFDKPGITQHGVAANVGIQWGIFFALAAAGLLAYAGSRMRAAQRPSPPLLRRSPPPHRPPDPLPRRPPDAAPTVVVRPAAPVPARAGGAPIPAKRRERYPPAPGEDQLSFEDQPDLPLR
jgi:hypothetical protein